MCLANQSPERHGTHLNQLPARPKHRTVQPLTWIVTVALMPVLLYDVWQTVQDVKHHHAGGATDTAANLSSPAAARSHRLSD